MPAASTPRPSTGCWATSRRCSARSATASIAAPAKWPRSEEHTSELQSHLNLVCRLLLEKKKKSGRASLRAPRALAARSPERPGTARVVPPGAQEGGALAKRRTSSQAQPHEPPRERRHDV